MKDLRIVFMGTPDFATPTLQALIQSRHKVVGVFCQPDKAKGRGQKLQMPPVKELALENGIPVFQPTTLSDEESKKIFNELRPDIIIVIAYGKILPAWLLNLPPYGCINLHASILPKHRGAAPIQWAILEGDKDTGITIMQMDEGMDTGDILEIIPHSLSQEETSGELFTTLAELGGSKIVSVLDDLIDNKLQPKKQCHDEASYTQKITKQMGLIDWKASAMDIDRKIRALSPWPGTYTYIHGVRLKIWKATPIVEKSTHPVGTLLVEKNRVRVVTGDGLLSLISVQLENKKCVSITDFINSNFIHHLDQFTNEVPA